MNKKKMKTNSKPKNIANETFLQLNLFDLLDDDSIEDKDDIQCKNG